MTVSVPHQGQNCEIDFVGEYYYAESMDEMDGSGTLLSEADCLSNLEKIGKWIFFGCKGLSRVYI